MFMSDGKQELVHVSLAFILKLLLVLIENSGAELYHTEAQSIQLYHLQHFWRHEPPFLGSKFTSKIIQLTKKQICLDSLTKLKL